MPHITAMLRQTLVLLATLLGLVVATPAHAQWKWRDKNGHIQYSDIAPPAGTPDASILQRSAAATVRVVPIEVAASGASGAASGVVPKAMEPELEAKRKKAEQEKADKLKAEGAQRAAKQAENCARAKGYLRTLQDGVRITRSNDKGEREYLDDKGRADETQRTQSVISADCK